MHIHRTWRQLVVLSLIAAICIGAALAIPARAAAPHATARTSTRATCKTPTPSGTIKYSDWQFPTGVNPYQSNASVTWEIWDAITEPMVIYDHKGHAVPDLITKIPTPTNGGKTYTVTLKKGLRWSNGQPITSADIKFGNAINNNAATGPWCSGSGCDQVARVDTPNKYTAVFHLRQPYAAFSSVGLFADNIWPVSWPGPNGWASGDVAGAAKQLAQNVKYTFGDTTYPTDGAYQITQYSLNDRIVLQPMKYYHTMSCGASVKQLIFVFYSSKPDMIAAAGSKDTDATTDYTLADVAGLKKVSAIKTDVSAGFEIEQLHLNVDKTYNGKPNPLADARVRAALGLALDKYGLIESALGVTRKVAASVIPWNFIINSSSFVQPFADKAINGQWDPIRKKFVSDTGTGQALADAKTLLAQAGYPGGHFSLDGDTTTGNPVRQAEFAVIQKNWAAIGVTFVPNYVPAGTFFSDWDHNSPLAHGAFQVGQFTDVGYPDPATWATSVESQYVDRDHTTHNAINANYSGIRDKVIDNAMNKASSSTVKSVRQHWYTIVQMEMAKQSYWIPEYYRPKIDTTDGNIGNFSQNPTNTGAEWNIFNWTFKGKS